MSPDRLLPNRKLREAVDSYKRTLSNYPSSAQVPPSGMPPAPTDASQVSLGDTSPGHRELALAGDAPLNDVGMYRNNNIKGHNSRNFLS